MGVDTKSNDSRNFTTGTVRAAWPNVFNMRKADKEDPLSKDKYDVCLIIDKSDESTVAIIKGAIRAAGESEFGAEQFAKLVASAKAGGNFKIGLRDGDVARPDDENFKGKYFINCSSQRKPRVVTGRLEDINSPDDFASGDYCRVAGHAYGFERKGNKGVAFGFSVIQRVRRGVPILSGPDPKKLFTAIDDEENMPLPQDDGASDPLAGL